MVGRVAAWAAGAAVLVSACGGGGELTLTEYVDRVDAVFARGIERYQQVVESPEGLVLIVGQGSHMGFDDGGARLSDFTPRDLQVALEQVAGIQEEALAAAAEIEPPAELAELHALYFRRLPIAELAARAGAAASWEELSGTPEMAAYRAALAADNQVCAEFQEKLDDITARGVFADTPWMPSELTDLVEYGLGCADLPANPDDAYRPADGG